MQALNAAGTPRELFLCPFGGSVGFFKATTAEQYRVCVRRATQGLDCLKTKTRISTGDQNNWIGSNCCSSMSCESVDESPTSFTKVDLIVTSVSEISKSCIKLHEL